MRNLGCPRGEPFEYQSYETTPNASVPSMDRNGSMPGATVEWSPFIPQNQRHSVRTWEPSPQRKWREEETTEPTPARGTRRTTQGRNGPIRTPLWKEEDPTCGWHEVDRRGASPEHTTSPGSSIQAQEISIHPRNGTTRPNRCYEDRPGKIEHSRDFLGFEAAWVDSTPFLDQSHPF